MSKITPHLPAAKPSDFLTAPEAAALLRVSPVTLGRWRIEGCGPPYKKFGRRVLYACSDVLFWADAQTRLNTSEPAHTLPGWLTIKPKGSRGEDRSK
jgi:hypothetical protein